MDSAKLNQLKEFMAKAKIDLAIFPRADPNLKYFNSFSECTLAIPRKKEPFIIVSEMESERAKKLSRIKHIIPVKADSKLTMKDIIEQKAGKFKTAGVNKLFMTVAQFERLKKNLKAKLVDVSGECAKLRQTKTAEEIGLTRKSCEIASEILKRCIARFKGFKTEFDVSLFLEAEARKAGCEPSFPTKVASGKNSSMPHHDPSSNQMQKGFCIIDFGVNYKGYCSDMTRTIYVGKPSEKKLSLYGLVKSTQEKVVKQSLDGKKCADLDKKARKLLGKYSDNFIHSLGHGVGIEIHESPSMNSKSKDKLEPGMVVAIEPGIYFKDKFGIRIEDTILITKGKPEVLTDISRELVIIKK